MFSLHTRLKQKMDVVIKPQPGLILSQTQEWTGETEFYHHPAGSFHEPAPQPIGTAVIC